MCARYGGDAFYVSFSNSSVVLMREYMCAGEIRFPRGEGVSTQLLGDSGCSFHSCYAMYV